jgi:hypothetical protein
MRSIRGNYTSTKTGRSETYDSSYELRRFIFLDGCKRIKSWTKRHKIRIKYLSGKKRRTYIPDILVEMTDGSKVLEEVKGHVFDRRNFVKKNIAARGYCLIKGMKFRIIFEKDLEVVV